jgi:hypothetical protein
MPLTELAAPTAQARRGLSSRVRTSSEDPLYNHERMRLNPIDTKTYSSQ